MMENLPIGVFRIKAQGTRKGKIKINLSFSKYNSMFDDVWISCRILLTCAAGGDPRPGAVSLAQPDAGALEVIVRQAAYTAGRVKVVIADVLDEEAIFWWSQRWAVHHWDSRGEETDTGGVQQADIHF